MFHIAQHEDLEKYSIVCAKRLRQPLPGFLSFEGFGRYLAPVGKIPRRIFTLFLAARTMTVESFHGHCPFPSPPHQSLVHRNLDQPRAESRFRPKLADIHKSL